MIIGSYAIKHWFPDFNREPKDIDVVGMCTDFERRLAKSENLRLEVLDNPVLDNYGHYFCPQDALYTLKISHSLWALDNGSWDKHIFDIQFLKKKGCIFNPELFEELFAFWTEKHGPRKSSNLNMTAAEFFDNAVNFPYDHDFCHQVLIREPYFEGQKEPTYKKILKDGAEVDVSEEKFNLLSEKEKFNLVFEEVANMANERYNKMFFKAAYRRMLKKFILSHAPVWEAIWIIQNWENLVNNIPFNFLNFLKNELTASQ